MALWGEVGVSLALDGLLRLALLSLTEMRDERPYSEKLSWGGLVAAEVGVSAF